MFPDNVHFMQNLQYLHLPNSRLEDENTMKWEFGSYVK